MLRLLFQPLLVIWIVILSTTDSSFANEPFPAPFTKNNRIYAQILAYNFIRMDPILRLFTEYKSMCEGGWQPTIVFITTVKVSDMFMRYIATKTYCYRIQSSFNVTMYINNNSTEHNKLSGLLLADVSRSLIKQDINNYNVFIYHEEDIMVQYSHLIAYLHETKELMKLLSNSTTIKHNGLIDYTFGFQRHRHIMKINRNAHMTEKEIIHQELLDEVPLFKPICIENKPYIQVISHSSGPMTNPHQAMYILTKQQILLLQEKCNFFTQSVAYTDLQDYTREYMSSLSLFENHITPNNCGLKKLLPAEHFTSFSVIHYYASTNTAFTVDTHPLFTVEEHIKAGLIQFETPLSIAAYYNNLTCWEPIIEKNRLIQNITSLLESQDPIVFRTSAKSREIFYLDKGVKRAIANMDAFVNRGFKLDNVILIDHPGILHALPEGPPVENATD